LGFEFGKWETVNGKRKTDCVLRVLLDKNGVLETQILPLEPTKTNLVTISKTPVNSKEKLLYHKTTYRPWYGEAMKKIKKGLIFDEIFFNEKGALTEGARSNIILQIKGELFTPPVECGLLNGILRQEMLNNHVIPKQKSLYNTLVEKFRDLITMGCRNKDDLHINTNFKFRHDVHEKILFLSDLQKAEKIYCINSVRGIVEVEIDYNPRPLRERVAFNA